MVIPWVFYQEVVKKEDTWYRDGTTITIGAETITVSSISTTSMSIPTKRVDKNGLVGDVTSISSEKMNLPIKIVDKNGLVGNII